MECRLILTTLSGTVVEITTSVAQYDRLEDLEDHVVDYLASVTDLKVFGRTVDFLRPDTHTYLDDPIWEDLQRNTEFTVLFRDCAAILDSERHLWRMSISWYPTSCPYSSEPGRFCSCWCFHGSAAFASRQCRNRHQGNWSRSMAKLPASPSGQDAQLGSAHCGQYLSRVPTA